MITSNSRLVRIETVSDDVTVDSITYDRGSIVAVDVGVAEALGSHVRLLPRPMLRAKRAGTLIGYRVCAKDEVAASASVAIAEHLDKEGGAVYLNRAEVGTDWRAPERPGLLPVRLLTAMIAAGGLGQARAAGSIVEVPKQEAWDLIDAGMGEAVGWRWAAKRKVKVKATGERLRVGDGWSRAGQVLELEWDDAGRAIRRGEGTYAGKEPIAWTPAEG
jgi:hypothetical protein